MKEELTEKQRLQKKQRRLLTITLAILILWGGLLWVLLGLLPEGEQAAEPEADTDISKYLQEEWPDYTLKSFDEQSGAAVIQGSSSVTYAQAEQYGEEAYGELMDSYIATARALAAGLRLDCGVEEAKVRLEQRSTDGQVIFSVTDDGQIHACWEP